MDANDHAREAERLIDLAEGMEWDATDHNGVFTDRCIAVAQVHALLALTGKLA